MVAERDTRGPRARSDDDEVTEGDYEMAEEIALFVADRAFAFEDRECRAWALTDFGVWATLAGRTPTLQLADHGSDVTPSEPESGASEPGESGSGDPESGVSESGEPEPDSPDQQ